MDEPIDLNNNAEEKSYSLRPRTSLKSNREYEQEEDGWKPRGRTKKRPKQKSAPLSKYRRKTANARERSRMREINEAFEALRRAVPHLNSTDDNSGEKISKIMTLRLAMKYITALSTALSEPDLGDICLSDIVLGCGDALTPGSLSEHSALSEDFFPANLAGESLSSPASYDVPGLITPPLCDSTHLPSFDRLRTPSSASPSTSLHPLPASTLLCKPDTPTQVHNQLLPSHCDLRTNALTPPEDVSRHFSSYQFKESSLSSSFPTASFLTDFDGLPSPAMDFEELFIK